MSFLDFWGQSQARLERALLAFLPPETRSQLHEAMHYAVFNGGKRLRALLVYAVADIFSADSERVYDGIAAAIECIHSYSLVHDDLPAMDDDDLRRGKPSCHIAFDEATAILCGDALQCFAFELLASLELPPEKIKALILTLSHSVGSEGVALGQHYDLINHCQNEADLEMLHRLKTGKLIVASVVMSYQASPQVEKTIFKHLTAYAEHLGLAYQICDDILDYTQSTEQLGKPTQSDLKNKKTTFVTFYGLEKARAIMHDEIAKAKQHLQSAGLIDTYLSDIAQLFIERDK